MAIVELCLPGRTPFEIESWKHKGLEISTGGKLPEGISKVDVDITGVGIRGSFLLGPGQKVSIETPEGQLVLMGKGGVR